MFNNFSYELSLTFDLLLGSFKNFKLPVVAISLTILGYISVINIQAMR